MYPAVDNSPEFHALLSGEAGFDLALVALEIAADAYPDLDPRVELRRINQLAEQVSARLGPAPETWLTTQALNFVLFQQEALRGAAEDYYDPRSSYLNQVLERRVGIPISLSLLYMAVAERADFKVHGVNLPAHFVLRAEIDGETVFIDPYHGGCLLTRDGLKQLIARIAGKNLMLSDSQFAACTPALVIRRLLYNLKLIYLRSRSFEAVIPVLKRLTLLSRDTPAELRDLGIACFYSDHRDESAGYLAEYLKLAPNAEDGDEIRLLLRSTGGAT